MRNLKRALSLAVASVMLLGMMVVGTGASYDDVTSADNQEAIEVLQAVGIMTGDDQGNFNPDQNVTRAEMAVIMTKVLDLNTGNYSVSAMPFTDVPDWAKSYVAAIYAEGVTGGISDTLYGTDDPITAAQMDQLLLDMKACYPDMTTVVVTHDLGSVEHIAEHVLVLRAGKAVFAGSRKELSTASDPYLNRFLHRKFEESRRMAAPPLDSAVRGALAEWLDD